jgi:hypothetical protein
LVRIIFVNKGGIVMIDYSKIKVDDTLKIVGAGAPGYANNGEVVTVTKVTQNSVTVVNEKGEVANFMYACGAERLEKVEPMEMITNDVI